MATAQPTQSPSALIKKALEAGKLIIGTKEVLDAIRGERVAAVYTAANCPAGVLSQLDQYRSMSSFSLEQLNEQSDALAVLCKKAYPISVLAIQV